MDVEVEIPPPPSSSSSSSSALQHHSRSGDVASRDGSSSSILHPPDQRRQHHQQSILPPPRPGASFAQHDRTTKKRTLTLLPHDDARARHRPTTTVSGRIADGRRHHLRDDIPTPGRSSRSAASSSSATHANYLNNNNNIIPTSPSHNSNNSNTITPYDTDNANDESDSSSRITILAFLLLTGIAIAHAIALGFEGMHNTTNNGNNGKRHPPYQQPQIITVVTQQQPEAFSKEDMNGMPNNEIEYDNRSVNANNNKNSGNNNNDIRDSTTIPSEEDGMGDQAMMVATILSRSSQLSSLISNLDASDVVECYVVTRMAHLHNVASSAFGGGSNNGNNNNNNNNKRSIRRMLDESMAASSTFGRDNVGGRSRDDDGPNNPNLRKKNNIRRALLDESTSADSASTTTTINNPSGPVLVRKSALAFRYRPRVAASSHAPAHFSAGGTTGTTADDDAKDDDRSYYDDLTPNDRLERRKYFELTLEYGPQRTGAARTSESMPTVHVDTEMIIVNNNNNANDHHHNNGEKKNGNNHNGNNDYGKFVSWENEGRVYHTTRISNEWTEAYYMAAITGVVFEKIVQRAVEYAIKRPRYQPFEVVSIPSGSTVLRSSGADDFVWDMFRDMAELYVDIDPILVPPRGKVQFYVADPIEEATTGGGEGGDSRRGEGEGDGDGFADDGATNRGGSGLSSANGRSSNRRRRIPNPNVKQVKGPLEGSHAAVFYENFFNCANAVKTGDYSMYVPPPTTVPTSSPTLSMVPTSSPTLSMTSSVVADYGNGTRNETSAGGENVTHVGDGVDENGGVQDDEIPNIDDLAMLESGDNETKKESISVEGATDDSLSEDDRRNGTRSVQIRRLTSSRGQLPRNRRKLEEKKRTNTTEEAASDAPEKTGSAEVNVINEEEDDHVTGLSLSEDATSIDSGDLDGGDDGEDDPAEAAIEAAFEAAKAAENAAAVVATNTSSAADTAAATSQAAIAALKAKDASVAARSKSTAEALLSGDGELMTSVLSNCFSDPKYGIRTQEEIRAGGNHDPTEKDSEGESHVVEKRDTTFAYIYLDGNIFIRLNLTAPYWGTISALETVPPHKRGPEGRGDAVDWAIFMLILAGTLFGFLVMVHQVGIVIDKRLRFRHIFHPTKNEDDWEFTMEREDAPLRSQHGGGFLHSELRMTVESIPTSMGGGGASSPPRAYRDNPDSRSIAETNGSNGGLDLEMAERRQPNNHRDGRSPTSPRKTKSSPRKASFADGGKSSQLPDSLRIKRDTPDLVERPSLKSKSKIALPQQSPRQEDIHCKKLDFEGGHERPVLPLPLDD